MDSFIAVINALVSPQKIECLQIRQSRDSFFRESWF